MLTPKLKHHGVNGTIRIFNVLVVGCLAFSISNTALADGQSHLELAPIELSSGIGGNLGYQYLSFNTGTSRYASQMLNLDVNGRVRARSYFWQPWLAQVTTLLGAELSNSTTRGGPSSTSSSSSSLITGNAQLALLKYSRFPFTVNAFQSKSHTGGFIGSNNYDSIDRGFNVTQKYETLNGNFDSFIQYSKNRHGTIGAGTQEIRNQTDFMVTTLPAKFHTFRFVGAFDDITYPLINNSLVHDSLVINHSYRPAGTFSVASMLNVLKNDSSSNPAGTSYESVYKAQQFSSYAGWRPVSPLTVTSSVRLAQSNYRNSVNNVLSSAPFSTDVTNFNLGANYAWSRLLRAYGSVNVYDDSGIQTITTNASLTAQKMLGEQDAINIGGFRYTRFAGASIANSTATTSGSIANPNQTSTTSVQTLGGNLGHALTKNSPLGDGKLNVGLSQRLSEVLSSQKSPNTHLNSAGSMSWRTSKGRETTNIALHAVDSRALSGLQNFFQLVNLQATRQVNLLHHQTLTGNLTIQTSRSGNSGISTPFVTSPSADLRYENDRVYMIKNLTFSSTLHVTGADIVSSQNAANLNFSSGNTARTTWDNNLDYFIGKLRLRLYSHIAEINQERQSSLLFSLQRAF